MTNPPPPAPFELALAVRPAELRLRDRRSVSVDLTLTNRSALPLAADFRRARLLVDGEESVYFTLAMSNGVRETAPPVAPGDSVTQSWPGMGPTLFPRPGAYELVLAMNGVQAPPVVVQVRRW